MPQRLGRIALEKGRAAEAEAYFTEACDFVEELAEPLPIDHGLCRLHLGRSLLAQSRDAAAASALQQAAAHFAAAGDDARLAEAREARRSRNTPAKPR